MNIATSTVFLLEDEPIIAFALEDMLQAEGAQTRLATSLEEGTALLAEAGIDCGILDVNVHGEKSYALAERLLELGIPFVFATGYGDARHPAPFAAIHTISKPYTPSQIREAIAALV